MTTIERAFQQLDPLGALAGRPVSLFAAVGIPVFALVMTIDHHVDVADWSLAVLSLMAIAASGAALAIASSPLRAPFTVRAHILVSGLACLSWALSVASTWGANRFVRDDWAPIAVGLVLLSLSQYRPPKEIASTGVVLALIMGVVALPQADTLVTPASPIAIAIVTMTPVLALSLASAAFGQLLVDALVRWQRRARLAVNAVGDVNTGWIARSVQQDRVTILNKDIVPFLSEVLQKEEVTDEDRARAREIAGTIRSIMVAEADRTWLDLTANQIVGDESAVVDPHRLATLMSTDQRTALRALLVALTRHAGFSREGFGVGIRTDGTTCQAVVAATVAGGEGAVRTDIAPFLAVLRIVFRDVRVEFSGASLALRFSYEHR